MERLRGARRRLAVDARRWGGDETVASVRRQRAGTEQDRVARAPLDELKASDSSCHAAIPPIEKNYIRMRTAEIPFSAKK
jgi:hypothetical protein